ncbi:3-beta hydroxysteroid dehydrogenase [Arthrobacter sp. MYb211]|uniref:SDR family oxidoreductase n=1 Tax=Micrococcaceae TaxID=1268 RepID=UPI000CFE1D75|nr:MULTISPECIES: SDR family oxidoreductase [unclassified Arthrobacter]PRA13470.1 3-beta hydroxysteroid dehydrogenase [Arthrobacter sp. MYb221]PRC10669.1 3-beta hydroxysteroid dehydrogenase [Arthrobacter sp. MYb211]
MKIAIAGGTGTIGRHVVAAVEMAGHQPLILTRKTGMDLLTGRGLAQALAGVGAVIDVTSTTSMRTSTAVEFFTKVTENLLAAGRAVGSANHVALSIIGALAVDAQYYAGKAAQERLLMAQPGGYTLLRTSQFHEFAGQMQGRLGLGPAQFAPAMRSQPIAAAEVAAELVKLAVAQPQGVVADLAGPREERMVDLVRAYLKHATGRAKRVMEIPIPGPMGRAMRDGTLLPGTGARLGSQTFADWLQEQQRQ